MTLEAIGQKLKSAREAQGLSLRQIYERTKIPINHLQAIDGGQPDDLPEPVYVAGFIKRYAECIGLDGQVLADEYRREEAGNAKPAKQSAQPVYVTPDYLKHTRIDQTPPNWKLWPFYALIVLGVVGVVSYFSNHANTQNQQDPNVLSLQQSVQHLPPGQQGITAPTPAGTAPATEQAQATNGDHITLAATQHVWVEVKKISNGDDLYTGYLEQGDKKDFQDSQGLRVRAGNGGSLSVEFKGKIETFGTPGKVAERTFSTQNAVATSTTQQSPTPAASGDATASATAAANAKSKVRKTSDTTTTSTKVATKRHHSDDGTRSIPGESLGDGGTRSIDVPYRYSEGRLDSN